jgi:hypothetical protein
MGMSVRLSFIDGLAPPSRQAIEALWRSGHGDEGVRLMAIERLLMLELLASNGGLFLSAPFACPGCEPTHQAQPWSSINSSWRRKAATTPACCSARRASSGNIR